MKYIIFILSILSLNLVHSTPSRIVDKRVQFAIASVNGFNAFTEDQKNALILEYPAGAVVNFTPEAYEINLSTCLVIEIDGELEEGFSNYTEWLSCQTRAGLKRKIRKIRQLIDSMSDLPATETRELRERAGWVKSYYLSLP